MSLAPSANEFCEPPPPGAPQPRGTNLACSGGQLGPRGTGAEQKPSPSTSIINMEVNVEQSGLSGPCIFL